MCLEGGTLPFMSSCGIKTSVLRTNRRRVSVGPWRCCSARLPCLSGYQFLLVPQVCKEVSGRTDAEVRKHTEVRVPSLRHTFATNFVSGQKQPGGTIRKAIPSTAHITAIMQAVQFSSKATETQKYLYFSCLQSRHCSIFISNPSRSSRLCRWLLPQALKILKYLYIPYSFVKVSLGFFLFFILKIRTSLWQFRR